MSKKSNTVRSDGRIAVQVYLGTVDGRRKYKTVYGKTQKEADKLADEVRAQLGKGIDVTSNHSFSHWIDMWLQSIEGNKSASQYAAYSYRAEYFKSVLGNRAITKIKLCDVQNAIDELGKYNPRTGNPTAKRTLLYYSGTVKRIFDYAIANRVIDYNPASMVEVSPKAPKSARRALTQEEQNRIVEMPHRAQTAAMIMMYAGLRRGELTALLWSDVDFEKQTISVNKSYDFKNKAIKSTKTASGNRIVPIPDILAEYLKGIKRTSLFVFPSKTNEMMSSGAWQRLWVYYLNALNRTYGDFSKIKKAKDDKSKKLPMAIEPFTPHCLRHTYCSLLYEAGVDVVTAKELMGHKDIQTTLGIYTHLSKEKAEKDISKFNDFLKCKSNASQQTAETVDT